MKKVALIVSLFSLAVLQGCSSAMQHRENVRDNTDRVTVGTVQKEIKVGMPASDVAAALGSPNIVSTDENRLEVWIYDKLATEAAYSTSSGGVSGLALVFGAIAGGGLGGGYESSSGASSKSQRTLTVIIKFDENNLVRDFAYHTSRF